MHMKIYTGQGDGGITRRGDGTEVAKDDIVIEAVAAIDELNAELGVCESAAAADGAAGTAAELRTIQGHLFAICSMVSGSPGKTSLPTDAIANLEKRIDAIWNELPDLKHFILPGGCELAGRLHVARTVCRRAERRAVTVSRKVHSLPQIVLRYLNRLSDLLFAMARQANASSGAEEQLWLP